MKKRFRYYPLSRQYFLNYNGKPINIDKDDFEKMSEDDVLNLIKNLTRQEPKKEIENNLSPEEVHNGFAEIRKKLGMPPFDPTEKGALKKFIKGRMRNI